MGLIQEGSRSIRLPLKCLLCFAVLSTTVSQRKELECPYLWNEMRFSGSCIHHMKARLFNWDEARQACRKEGGDLVKIPNLSSHEDVAELLRQIYKDGWFGLKREKSGEDFKWLDEDTKAPYTKWFNGTPSRDGRLCGLLKHGESTWTAEDCSLYYKPICEKYPACDGNRYGPGCLKNCSPHCGGATKPCHNTDGQCLSGCDAGHQGYRCESECDDTTYGANCNMSCSENCKGARRECNDLNGTCVLGCRHGFRGDLCKIPTSDGIHVSATKIKIFVALLLVAGVICITLVTHSLINDHHVHKSSRPSTTRNSIVSHRSRDIVKRFERELSSNTDSGNKVISLPPLWPAAWFAADDQVASQTSVARSKSQANTETLSIGVEANDSDVVSSKVVGEESSPVDSKVSDVGATNQVVKLWHMKTFTK